MNNELPYPGLRPFERDETDIFFGREDHTDQLLEKLGQNSFLAVVGPSGCGKSSLVRTGLLAGLEGGLLTSAGIHWRIAEMRPGNHPFANLADALLDESALSTDYSAHFADNREAKASLQATLRRGPLGLDEIWQDAQLPTGTRLLLLVDQFEELFRYYQQGEVEETAAFVALLLASYQNPNVYVIITMRSDFIGDCAAFYGLPEAVNQGLYLTPRLNRAQLGDAMALPASVFGFEAEPALISCLLNDAGNDPDQLPIVQHALMRIWTVANENLPEGEECRLTLAHYEQIGGFKNALSNHADKAYNELTPAQQKIAEILFRNLSERDSSRRDTRRPTKLAEIASLAQVDWQAVVPVVEAFRRPGRSFLVPPVGKPLEPDTVLDISHESLIRQWQRMQGWLNQEADLAELYMRIEETAHRWKKGKAALLRSPELEHALAWRTQAQPTAQWAKRYGQYFELAMRFLEASEAQKHEEQRQIETLQQRELQQRERWQRRITFSLVIFLVMVSGLAGVAGWQWWESQQKGKKANKLLQIQTENNLFNSIKLVDAGHKILEKFIDDKMKDAFVTFIDAYQIAGRAPSRMDLEALKRQMGGKMDLYIINAEGIVEYTTYTKDLGLDFKTWPDLFSVLTKIRQQNEFANGGFAAEARTGSIRKFAYMPTPDHNYLLELGLRSNEFADLLGKLNILDITAQLKTLNPSINQVRIFSRHGYSSAEPNYKPDPATAQIIQAVYDTQKTHEIEDKVRKRYTRYIFVNLKDEDISLGSDPSRVIELTYNNLNYQ
ncbi:MAG: hypothetical protein DRR19_01350 [Candidatus Parabeggiatoa sp. nov. 1]|nr:MAG: hypothetical protein DRR19_01350 [Gammaproteobacteria bacterium]